MKNLLCALVIAMALTACGNSPSNTNGTDTTTTTVSPDSSMHNESGTQPTDTMHKDSVVH